VAAIISMALILPIPGIFINSCTEVWRNMCKSSTSLKTSIARFTTFLFLFRFLKGWLTIHGQLMLLDLNSPIFLVGTSYLVLVEYLFLVLFCSLINPLFFYL